MRFLIRAAIALTALTALTTLTLLTACSPTFNWRDVRPDGTRLALLLPCKPDKAHKAVPIAGQQVEINLLNCDAGGVTFAVSTADVSDAAKTGAVLAQWQSAALINIKAALPVSRDAFVLQGLASGGVVVKATGQRSNGQAVNSHAVYFAQGSRIFQAVIYADKIDPDVADTFFSSLKFE